jgi:hypothetical protein
LNNKKFNRLLIGDFTLKRLILSPLIIVILFYAGISLYAYFFSDTIIFQPQPSSYRDTNQIIKLKTEDGVQISAVYLNNPDSEYTILYSHGNAEDIGDIRSILQSLKESGFSVFAYDYRGYGTSAGKPSEQNAYSDAGAAYSHMVNNLGIAPNRIIALGRSVGGAVAVDLAHKKQLAGLIIENSFVTAYRVLTRIPLLPFDKFHSISKLKQVRCPVLVIHGKKDEVIPFWHGERLFQEANAPKLSFWVDEAGHNNLFEVAGNRYNQVLKDFVELIKKTM